MRDRAQLVVIGAGIVGTSAAYHLAELGVTDVLVIDQGPLFETGGSTSHAPGTRVPDERLADDVPARAVLRRPVLRARAERAAGVVRGRRHRGRDDPGADQELKRRRGYARRLRDRGDGAPHARGDRGADPDPRPRSHPRFLPRALGRDRQGHACRGGPRCEGRGEGRRVRGWRARHRFRHPGRHASTASRPSGVTSSASRSWSAPGSGARRSDGWPACRSRSRVVQHQLVWTKPLPELAADAGQEVVHPILRHQDLSLYFRQQGDRYALGNYRHEPILFEPRRPPPVPGRGAAAEHRAVHARALRGRVPGEHEAAPAA